MKKLAFLASVAALLAGACTKTPVQTASYDVIPLPQEVAVSPDSTGFILNRSTVIAYPAETPELKTDAEHLQGYIMQMTGHKLKITDKIHEKDVISLQANLGSENPEGYVMTVAPEGILINGTTAAGTFYGIQTLRKSIPQAMKSDVFFPTAVITDQPRFAYRGAHFDVSRHFFPVDTVKAFIDMIALHNINTFHWHLTDDQGWRVEIKSRPRLTEIGSKRPGTIIGRTQQYDTIPVEGFYTQDEIRDVIKYAADRHITIIPEIDMPGHMLAALATYPELGCTGGPYSVWQRWGVAEDVLCPGKDSTYIFIDDVLGEIADLFPSEYIHVGGDECPKTRWESCEKCQAKIAELGLKTDEHSTKEMKLQSHIIRHAGDFLASKGKKMIGWDETLEGGLADGSIVMSWRGEKGGIEAAKLGHDVIMTPNTYLYFDYYQTQDHEGEPESIGNYLPLEKVYSYEPVTDLFTPEEAKHIIGIQANLWTEFIKNFNHATYNELPRMAALSDVQWSNAPKDYSAFLKRVLKLMNHYKANGYNYSTRAFDVKADISTDPTRNVVVFMFSTPDDAPVHYTLDGSEPTAESALYEDAVIIPESGVIKAVAVRRSGNSRVYTDSVTFNKATAHPVTLAAEPARRYAGNGAQTLVDGVYGGNSYSSAGWIGFNGDDMIATIDLEKPQPVSNAELHTCVATGAWVFDARGMKVEVSNDGKSWREVAAEQYPALESDFTGVVNHKVSFDPVEAQYVRVTLDCEKNLPEWHSGRGKSAFIFVDEITIN